MDYSHFNIMGTAVRVQPASTDPDKAIFSRRQLESWIGVESRIKLDLPIIIALWVPYMAADNWEPGCRATICEGHCNRRKNRAMEP